MDTVKERNPQPQTKWGNLLENLAIIMMAFYPLRHISLGLDLWDTGYNYANFQYAGTRHMDSMWLFSTYLANVTGSFLRKLPRGDTLYGMNLYTGLFVSILALAGYFFCTRKLGMPKWVAFLGEMAAMSLCWCPTALLYNYLTYVLFLVSSILLYLGLTREKRGYLIAAGVLLGTNVFVRFSNLPEMAMIVAVWAYDFILWLEGRRGRPFGAGESETGRMTAVTKGFWKRTALHTLWCLLGYMAALGALLIFIHIRYGLDEYVAGIQRLFAMTENAPDYKATSMIMGIVGTYVEHLYWVVRIGGILAGGMVLFAAAGWLEALLVRFEGHRRAGKAARVIPAGARFLWAGISAALLWQLYRKNFFSFLLPGPDSIRYPELFFLVLVLFLVALAANVRILHGGVRLLWAAVCGSMLWWLYQGGFFSLLFYSYDPIWHPGPLFLMLTMLIAAIRIFHRNSPREEKLISGMIILIILLTSIGSNNGVFPSLNNLFLAAPYMLWECWRFLCRVRDRKITEKLTVFTFPVKSVLTAFLALCLFVFGCFGAKFAFAEATGIQDATAFVGNNAVLKNIKMSPEKAQWMTEISAYVNENGLQGKEVILYGYIPALSYYLQMPAAFNPWIDLDSYSLETMEQDMARLEAMITEKGQEKPVIILEDAYASYREESEGEEEHPKIGEDPKWALLQEFMEEFRYEQTFRNAKFAVYR